MRHNNLDQFGGPGQLIYLFAVALPSTDISMSPPNWAYAQENVGYGGPVYNNAWCINACGNVDLTLAIHTGQALTGFQAVDTALLEPTSILWAKKREMRPPPHEGFQTAIIATWGKIELTQLDCGRNVDPSDRREPAQRVAHRLFG